MMMPGRPGGSFAATILFVVQISYGMWYDFHENRDFTEA